MTAVLPLGTETSRQEAILGVIDELIGMCNLGGAVDLRCHMSGDCCVEHDKSPEGEAAFHIVLSGVARLELSGRAPLTARAGSMILLPCGHAHRLHVCGGGTGPARVRKYPGLASSDALEATPDLDLLCGRFRYDRLVGPMIFDGLPPALLMQPEICGDTLGAITALIRHEAAGGGDGAAQIVTSLMTALFVLALRRSLTMPDLDHGIIALLADKALSPTITAMYRSPATQWSVASLAAESGMSRATFARRFTKRAGRGPAETLLAVRCQLALRQLRDTRRPIAEIAHEMGYACSISFGKAFARHTGITPVAARRGYDEMEGGSGSG